MSGINGIGMVKKSFSGWRHLFSRLQLGAYALPILSALSVQKFSISSEKNTWPEAAAHIINNICPNGATETNEEYAEKLKGANSGAETPKAAYAKISFWDIRPVPLIVLMNGNKNDFYGPEPICKEGIKPAIKPETTSEPVPSAFVSAPVPSASTSVSTIPSASKAPIKPLPPPSTTTTIKPKPSVTATTKPTTTAPTTTAPTTKPTTTSTGGVFIP